MLYVQQIGRGLRKAEDKFDCLVLDHSDTTLRLGLVTDINQDWLDDGKGRGPTESKVEQPIPKECPSCSFLKPAKVTLCPNCGFKPERQSKVQCEDGELIEITSKIAKKRWLSVDERRFVYGQLKHVALSRGYKRGWTRLQFLEFTGIYPHGVEDAPAMPPTPGMANWIKSRQVAYFRGRMAHGR